MTDLGVKAGTMSVTHGMRKLIQANMYKQLNHWRNRCRRLGLNTVRRAWQRDLVAGGCIEQAAPSTNYLPDLS